MDKALFRPENCPRYCIYNGAFNGEDNRTRGCEYKAHTRLAEPIEKWQSCPYFELIKDEGAKPEQYYDVLYGRFATYKDSHSAVWKD